MEFQKPSEWKYEESYFINSHSLQLAFEGCLLPMQSGFHELFINGAKSPETFPVPGQAKRLQPKTASYPSH